jgi:Ca2+-binding EF-hand superfamily protein
MLSDFQKSKLARRFELLDADGDGYITGADYDAVAANVCQAFGYAEGTPQHEKVHMTYLNMWVRLSAEMDREGGGRVSRKQYVAWCADSIVEAEGGYDRVIAPIIRSVFDLADADGNGVVDIEELTTWFNSYGVCADDAEQAFTRLDRNGDGLLDFAEVQRAVREFYTGDDPAAPGNAVFGPLPPVVVPVTVTAKPKAKAKTTVAKR